MSDIDEGLKKLLEENGVKTLEDGYRVCAEELERVGMEAAIEGVAKEICRLRGENPYVRRREYGQSSYDYWAWEDYRDEARDAIECVVARKTDA